jgi:hypothetical protein
LGYGDIVLSTDESSFVSSCIRWFTDSRFSHGFMTMPAVLDAPTCIEAVRGGVDMSRFDSNYLNDASAMLEVWSINLPQPTKDAALRQMLGELEISYGFLEYPWFVWRKLNSLVGRDIKSQNNWNTDGMICSQLVVAYLKALGLSSVLAGYGNGAVAPQDLRDVFVAHPAWFKISYTKAAGSTIKAAA